MGSYAAKSVLVVDDYKITIRIVQNLLRQIGFSDVDEASNGVEALSKLRGKAYDLVISDWNMEPMSGIELLRKMRAEPATRGTPFIMITAETKTDNVIAAKQAGANSFIVKPFNAGALSEKVASVLGPA
jgi:two-component system chemotaxis response regulator CheY